MALEIWKKREWRRAFRWGVFCLLCLLCLYPSDIGAVKVVETVQGKVLVGSKPLEAGEDRITDSGSRDPFNWSEEFIAQYLARMRSKQDLFVGLQLSGIVWNPQTPLAIINKELLKEGEMVENVTVLKISKDSVLLAREGVLHTLYFQQRIIDLGSESARKDKGSEERK
jgi:hypothetical protein